MSSTREIRTARRSGSPLSAPARLSLAVALALSGLSAGVQAQSLVDLYQAAKSYDAAYLSAKSQADSAQYKAAQAYAQRMPLVNLKGTLTRQHFDSSDNDAARAAASQAGLSSTNYSITSKQLALQGRQSLYNRSISASIEQADQSLVAAEADMKAAEDDLIVRLSQAYFDVLAAKDVLVTAQANKKALAEQLASAKRNFEVGNATITDTREAQARHDLATAQEIAAENDVKVKSIALDQLVGQQDVKPRPLMTPVALPALVPSNAEDWVTLTPSSPAIRKAEVGLEFAKLETKKARAEHLPTADLVASLSRNEVEGSGPVTVTATSGTTASLGVEVNVPIFTGFATQNKIKETLSLQDKSERDLDNAKRSVTLATRQAFFGVQSGMAQVKALEAAEASAKLALEATQLGYRVGVRVNKDVLDAQTALSSTQKDLYKARYDVIVATMKLRQASGSLKPEDLDNLNKLLSPQ
ncbi:MAG TPA: TolC family outer membrane protein [Aquabacterium sp.]|uniref:TolC family outer membrane protein n=1 Tax=Aquabacterium sp. TaxID=1872578 RepID=UPI002E33D3E7|nr:TolC family outer membrane protein [Aquabacterium sp.]HEX5374262.1 TolC family outer membrane protein [Aquabacterium sp.]